jgi:Trk K+ transport system NAD-binding subunit
VAAELDTAQALMARTTANQFARQLRRLGATVTVRDGHTDDREVHDVVARHHEVEVTARFSGDVDAFTVAWRSDQPLVDTAPIRSMADVRRVLNLPKQPVVTLATTGRRNSRIHILRPGWWSIAECGVSLRCPHSQGAPRDVTCPRCRSIWRQR